MSGEVITGCGAPAPSDAYGAAKAAFRMLCGMSAAIQDVPFIWTVVASLYGPGRDDDNILSYAVKTLLAGESPSFTKLEQQWDFLYIDDLIRALYLIGERGTPGKVYPIASGRAAPLSAYVTAVRDAIDASIPLGIGKLPYKNGIPDNAIFDIKELVADTGFEPKVSFETGVSEVIEYFRSVR
jgi:nucleoside-diphosphate-sugar epimerase